MGAAGVAAIVGCVDGFEDGYYKNQMYIIFLSHRVQKKKYIQWTAM